MVSAPSFEKTALVYYRIRADCVKVWIYLRTGASSQEIIYSTVEQAG